MNQHTRHLKSEVAIFYGVLLVVGPEPLSPDGRRKKAGEAVLQTYMFSINDYARDAALSISAWEFINWQRTVLRDATQ